MDKTAFYITLGLINATTVFKWTFWGNNVPGHTMGIKMSQFNQVKDEELMSS